MYVAAVVKHLHFVLSLEGEVDTKCCLWWMNVYGRVEPVYS